MPPPFDRLVKSRDPTDFKKVQYLRYARYLRICGLRLVNIHVRQILCILRNRASLDLELFTKPTDRDFYECIKFKADTEIGEKDGFRSATVYKQY